MYMLRYNVTQFNDVNLEQNLYHCKNITSQVLLNDYMAYDNVILQ